MSRRSTRASSHDSDTLGKDIVTLVNAAHTAVSSADVLTCLSGVKEIVFNRTTGLVVPAVTLVAEFRTRRTVDVQKFVLGFLDEATRVEPSSRRELFTTLGYLLSADSTSDSIKKRSLQLATTHLSPVLHSVVASSDSDLWGAVDQFIQTIDFKLDTAEANELPYLVKFLQYVMLAFSSPASIETRDPSRSNVNIDDFTLSNVPLGHPILRREELQERNTRLLSHLCKRLHEDEGQNITFETVHYATMLSTLSLLAAVRVELAETIIKNLAEFHDRILIRPLTQDTKDVVMLTLQGSLLRLMRLHTILPYKKQLLNIFESLGATAEATAAFERASEMQRRIATRPSLCSKRSAPDYYIERNTFKRTRSGEANAPKLSADAIRRMPGPEVVELVLANLQYLPPPPSSRGKLNPLAVILGQIASPASEAPSVAGGSVRRDPRRDPRKRADSIQPATVGRKCVFQKNQAKIIAQRILSVPGEAEGSDDSDATGGVEREPPAVEVKGTEVTVRMNTKLTNDDRNRVAHSAFRRILGGDQGAALARKVDVWKSLVARMVCDRWLLLSGGKTEFRAGELPPLAQEVVKYVLDEYAVRCPLALSTLYQEFSFQSVALVKSDGAQKFSMYDDLLLAFVTGLRSRIDTSKQNDKNLFRDFLLGVPTLTFKVLEVLYALVKEPSSVVLGITLLRDLVLERPPCRTPCLRILLSFTKHSDKRYRDFSVRCVANQLYENGNAQVISDEIEEHAKAQLRSLTTKQDIDDKTEEDFAPDDTSDNGNSTGTLNLAVTRIDRQCHVEEVKLIELSKSLSVLGEEAVAEDEMVTLQRLQLYLALCAKSPRLFPQLVTTYAKAPESVQDTIFRSVDALVKHLKKKIGDVAIVKLFSKDMQPRALPLVAHVLDILGQKSRPSDAMVSAVMQLYNEYNDASLVIPVVSGMDAAAIKKLIPAIIALPEEMVIVAISKMVDFTPAALPPVELLTVLHHLDVEENAGLQKLVIQAIDLCKGMHTAFTLETFALTLKNLVEETPIPRITMRTLIVAVTTYPKLKNIAVALMQRLVEREIWTMDAAIWKGFQKCAAVLRPHSFNVLLKLQGDQLDEVLAEEAALREPLREFALSIERVDSQGVVQEARQLLGLENRPVGDEIVTDADQEEDCHRVALEDKPASPLDSNS